MEGWRAGRCERVAWLFLCLVGSERAVKTAATHGKVDLRRLTVGRGFWSLPANLGHVGRDNESTRIKKVGQVVRLG
jgi:hypothetical protein